MPLPTKNTSKQFARQGSLLFLLRALPATAVLVVMILYARWLPQNLYGQYQNFWVRYGLLSTFTTIGLPAFLLLLSPAEVAGFCRAIGQRQILFFLLVNSLCGGLFSYWEKSLFPLWFPALFLLVWTLGLLLEALLISFRKLKSLLVINTVFAGVFLILHLALVPDGGDTLQQLLFAIGGLALARVLLLMGWALAAFRRQQIQMPVRARSIWFHLTLTDIIQQSGRLLDKVLLGLLAPPARSAVYFNGAQEIPFLAALLGAASGNFLLQASAGDSASELPQKAHWLQLTGAFLGALVFPLFWGLLLNRQTLFEILFAGRYLESVPVFTIFLFALPLRAYPFSALLQQLRKGTMITLGAFLDLVLAVGLALLLYPLLDLSGIALAFTIATVLLAVFYTVQTIRYTSLSLSDLFPVKTWLLQFVGSGVIGIMACQVSRFWGWTPLAKGLFSGILLLLAAMFLLKRSLRSAAVPREPLA